MKNRDVIRKSIVAARLIKSNEVISREAFIIKRPGSGIAPYLIDKILGLRARCDIEKGDVITWEKIKLTEKEFVS